MREGPGHEDSPGIVVYRSRRMLRQAIQIQHLYAWGGDCWGADSYTVDNHNCVSFDQDGFKDQHVTYCGNYIIAVNS